MIAVMGATGNVGGKVADLLLDGGEAVRVFGRSAERLGPLRRQGAEVLAGDAVNLDDLQELFRDAEGALVVLPDNVTDSNYVTNRSKMSQAIAQALRDQRVSYVVMASSLGAERERGGGPLNTLHELEALLFELESTSVLINRAALHLEQNLLPAIPMIQEQGMYGTALRGDLRIPLIATIDIAERAAGHLLHRDFSGHDVEMVLGPKDVTMEEATHVLGDALGIPDARYVQFPPEETKAALQGFGMSEEYASLLVEVSIAVNEGLFEVTRTPESTTRTRIEDFLRTALAPSSAGSKTTRTLG